MRVGDPAGWPWTVGRRWLPWRLCWLVVARGRRFDGVRVRYGAVAPRRGSAALRAAAAAEISADGVPRSLGDPRVVRRGADGQTERLRQTLRDGAEVRFDCHVRGFGASRSRDEWFRGQILAGPDLLSFEHMRGAETISWVLPGSDDVTVELAGPQVRDAIGAVVVASYATAYGPFRIAVEPSLGALLPDVLAAGAQAPAADPSLIIWRRDNGGAVREIALAGSRADAEVLAGTLENRGSRHTFWVAARR